MQYRRFGKTNWQVSEILLGGSWFYGRPENGLLPVSHGVAMVERAIELGINYFDSAPLYGQGHSDARVDVSYVDEQEQQLRYAIDVMGVEGVGIGTHFNSAVLPWVVEGLLDAGFSEEDVGKICGGNYLRVLREVLPA